jgi:ferrous iron transport protein A
MGLIKGTEFQVARMAPMGDPVEIRVRGFNLSLRKEEAKALRVRGIS